MATVYLLSGNKQSGKTSALFRFCAGNGCDGILMPDVDGQRFFYCISTRVLFPAIAAAGETELLEIGRFRFSLNAFKRAGEYIAACKPQGYLVTDEFGPLELEGKGLEPAISAAVGNYSGAGGVIISVRTELTEVVRNYFVNKGNTVITVKLNDIGELTLPELK